MDMFFFLYIITHNQRLCLSLHRQTQMHKYISYSIYRYAFYNLFIDNYIMSLFNMQLTTNIAKNAIK